MKRLAFSLLPLLVCGGPVLAQTAAELEIESRSAFEISSTQRNPFLPVGWAKPEAPKPAPGRPAPTPQGISTAFFRPEAFSVTTISTSTPRSAVINGRIYSEGDSINVPVQGQSVRVHVLQIRDGLVTLQYAGKKIDVTLRSNLPTGQ